MDNKNTVCYKKPTIGESVRVPMIPIHPFVSHPTPDFDRLIRVIRGAEVSRRAHLVELAIDSEVLMTLKSDFLHRPWAVLLPARGKK